VIIKNSGSKVYPINLITLGWNEHDLLKSFLRLRFGIESKVKRKRKIKENKKNKRNKKEEKKKKEKKRKENKRQTTSKRLLVKRFLLILHQIKYLMLKLVSKQFYQFHAQK